MFDPATDAARRSATMGAGPNAVLPVFETFQSARVEFAREVAKLADSKPTHGTYEVDKSEKVLAALEQSFHLMGDMMPLVNDQSAAVREHAMLAVGRLSGLSSKLHTQASNGDTILAATIGTINACATPSLLKAALFLLHSVVKSDPAVAHAAVFEHGALLALCERLEDMDSGIKAAAVWCIAAIADHEDVLALEVANSGSTNTGAIPLLLQCLKVRARTHAHSAARLSACAHSGARPLAPTRASLGRRARPRLLSARALRRCRSAAPSARSRPRDG
jgi:hypothetical protein